MKKYEFTEESKILGIAYGSNIHKMTLHRIRSLIDFSDVKAGDLGGWIEKEENLSHEGNAWVYDEAEVCGDAVVFENAKVYDNAKVWGKAVISGSAKVSKNAIVGNLVQVYENAQIRGSASIWDHAKVYGNAQVFGRTTIRQNAQVYENARVFGSAIVDRDVKISGEASIYGNANIEYNVRVSGNAKVHGAAYIGRTTDFHKLLNDFEGLKIEDGKVIIGGDTEVIENIDMLKRHGISKEVLGMNHNRYGELDLDFCWDVNQILKEYGPDELVVSDTSQSGQTTSQDITGVKSINVF